MRPEARWGSYAWFTCTVMGTTSWKAWWEGRQRYPCFPTISYAHSIPMYLRTSLSLRDQLVAHANTTGSSKLLAFWPTLCMYAVISFVFLCAAIWYDWVLYCEAIRTYLRTCGLVTPALLLSFIWQYNSALLGTCAPDSNTLDHAMHMHILHDMGHCSPQPWCSACTFEHLPAQVLHHSSTCPVCCGQGKWAGAQQMGWGKPGKELKNQ